jgi:hypothetical protein
MPNDDDKEWWKSLIKNRSSIPLLAIGKDGVGYADTPYPSNEHPGLLYQGNTVATPLNSILRTRTQKVPKKDLSEDELTAVRAMQEFAASITFKGSPNHRIPKTNWDDIHAQIEPLSAQHVKECLSRNRESNKFILKIFEPSTSFMGSFGTSNKKQLQLQMKALCVSLLADSPYEPCENEDEQIKVFATSDLHIEGQPSADDLEKIRILRQGHTRALKTLRDIINHTYLKTICQVSNKIAKTYIKQVHSDFLKQQHDNDGDDLFTAKILVTDIKARCLTSNTDLIESAKLALRNVVRQVPNKPLKWLKSHANMTERLAKAQGLTVLGEEDDLAWKKHFACQLTMQEREKIAIHKESKLLNRSRTAADNAKIGQIKHYLHGKFSYDVMIEELLTALDSDIDPFKPDTTVKDYMKHYASNKGWEHPVDFYKHANAGTRTKDIKPRENPSPKDKKRKSSTKERSKKDSRKSSSSSAKTSTPKQLWCSEPSCRERGNHTNHTSDDCRFRQNKVRGQLKLKNIGKAPMKGGTRKQQRQPEKAACWSCKTTSCTKHQCYICGKNHPKRECPDKDKVYDKIRNSNKFASMMTVFEPHHQPIMENIIHQWGVPNVCIKCHGRCPGKKCKSKNKNKKQGIKEVKTILSQNMDIVSTLDEAHLLSDDDSDSHPSVMNTSFFTTNVGHGSDSESVSDINDGFAGLFNNQKDVSSGEETYNDEKRAASEDSDDSAFNNNVLRTSNSRGSKRRKHQTSQVNSDNNDDSSSNSEQSDSDTDSRSSEYSAFST